MAECQPWFAIFEHLVQLDQFHIWGTETEMGKFFTLIQTYCGATTNAQSLQAQLQSAAHLRHWDRDGEIIHSDPSIVRVCYTTDAQSLKAQLQPEVKEDGSIRERSCRTPIWKTAWPEDLLLMEKLRRTWQPLRRTATFVRGAPGDTLQKTTRSRICSWWRKSAQGPSILWGGWQHLWELAHCVLILSALIEEGMSWGSSKIPSHLS